MHDSIDQLKPENRFRSLILVGKMSELSGEISQSISYYKMAIQFAAQKELAIEAITQILRLNASFDEAINFNDYSNT